MNHGIKGRKLGRRGAHREALLMNLAKELIEHESIVTTLPKAKEVRPIVEKLVTIGRTNTLHHRRRLLAIFRGDAKIVDKLFSILGKRYAERPGGYTRIVKAGFRCGDCAPMSVMQFV